MALFIFREPPGSDKTGGSFFYNSTDSNFNSFC